MKTIWSKIMVFNHYDFGIILSRPAMIGGRWNEKYFDPESPDEIVYQVWTVYVGMITLFAKRWR